MRKIIFLLLVLISGKSLSAACEGRIFNPVTDLNWNNAFPMTVGGVRTSPSGPNNPPLHSVSAVCNCGVKPGIGLTYWEPRFIAEVARTAGCLHTIGGVDVLGPASKYMSGESSTGADPGGSSTSRLQVHWYNYPALAMMDIATSYAGCTTIPNFDFDTPTELDPLWNVELASSVNAPEGLLFANPLAALSCIPDAATSMLNYPIDLLFWCAGSQGIVYPLAGRAQNQQTSTTGAMHIVSKYMAMRHKTGGLFRTIGPGAECMQIYSPVWVKSQYRFDMIYPIARNSTIVIGKPDLLWGGLSTTPTNPEPSFMIWRARQCCVAPY